jgi:1,4-alpha-glucan branching enzyme
LGVMMDTHTTVHYAVSRTKTHLENFNQLAEQIATEQIDEPWLRSLESRDCIFSSEELRSNRSGRPSAETHTQTSATI